MRVQLLGAHKGKALPHYAHAHDQGDVPEYPAIEPHQREAVVGLWNAVYPCTSRACLIVFTFGTPYGWPV